MDTEDARRELLRLRGSIDNMDSMLVHLLAERFKITRQVGRLKATAGLPPADPDPGCRIRIGPGVRGEVHHLHRS